MVATAQQKAKKKQKRESQKKKREDAIKQQLEDRRNTHEAFSEWFNKNIRSLNDIEAAGEDLLVVEAAWCAANNHEIRADGVYNMNIQPSKK